MIQPFNPGSHYDLISRLLTIIVLGGLGSLGGAIVAALFMGVARGGVRGRDLAHLVVVHVLHRADRDPALPAAGAVRLRRARRAVSRVTTGGLVRVAVVFGALGAFPFVFSAQWVVNIAHLHAHVRGAGHVVEPARRLLGLPVAGARGLLRSRRLRWSRSASRTIGSATATSRSCSSRSSGSRWRWSRCRSPGSPCACAHATFAIVTHHAAVRRAAARVQPALDHRRLAGPRDAAAAVPGGAPSSGRSTSPCWLCSRSRCSPAGGCAARKLGLMLFAIRDDEDRARGVGVRITGAKLIAFAVSVGLTAMIGGIWAYYIGVHLPAVRGRSAGHDRDGADDVPRRQGHALGPGARSVHPRAGAAVPRLPAGCERALPARLRRDVPADHAAPAARDHAVAARPARPAGARPRLRRRQGRGAATPEASAT